MVTICTTCCNINELLYAAQSVLAFHTIISLKSMNRLAFIQDADCISVKNELKFHIQLRLTSVFEGIITVIVPWKERITIMAVRLTTGQSDVKPTTARQVLIGIKLHTQAVLLNDITNKVTRIALDIFADFDIQRTMHRDIFL